VMAAYNSESFVMRTIESALAQTMRDFEYVIVDDGSTDRTAEVISGVEDARIRLLRQENQGPSGARNAALGEARGELIALLDHDDLWFEERLERLVAHLDSNPEVGFVSSDMHNGDPDHPESASTILANPACTGLSGARAWARGCGFSASTALVRRELFERHGAYDESLIYIQDWELMLRFWLGGETPAMLTDLLGWTLVRQGQLSGDDAGILEERRAVFRRLLSSPDLPKDFRSAAVAELRRHESDAAWVRLGAALDDPSADSRVVRRAARQAARDMHGADRLKALAAAVSPRAARAAVRRRAAS
jgi:glycosyltransferase involved in cell wall biosynthesis